MNFLKYLFLFLLTVYALLWITDTTYLISGVQKTYLRGNNTANIDDKDDFPFRVISTQNPTELEKAENYNQIPLDDSLQSYLKQYKTASFLILKSGKLANETYFEPYNQKSQTNSFSMAKSVVSLLMAVAIEEGKIKSLKQPITDFLPEFGADPLAQKCTVGDLSAMTSGYSWREDYTLPVNEMAKSYYGTELEKLIFSMPFKIEPGSKFEYQSGTTQILAILLQRATGKSLAEYASEKLWKPLEMESDAYWSLDKKDGIEKAFCCIHSSARDFAKLGQLMLDEGKYKGKQIVPRWFVSLSTKPGIHPSYGYSFWTFYNNQNGLPDFYQFQGHLGQYIIVVPSYDLVIVRTGSDREAEEPSFDGQNKSVLQFPLVREAIKMYPKKSSAFVEQVKGLFERK
ncbi:MAG: serine hydrolase [Flavobacteriaceae bacterium]|nr:MAG: serine hydrolase [Flavobacteriaceae bacterium]